MKLIIDGNGYAYRSFHNGGTLINAAGQDVTILYSFVHRLRHFLNSMEHVNELLMTWDIGASKARLELLPDYKANRDNNSDPSDNRIQVSAQNKILREELFPYLGIKQFAYEGIEADDVIGILVQALTRNPNSPQAVTIVSADKDMRQLINPYCEIYDPNLKSKFTIHNFEKRMGMPLEYYVDYLAIDGDKSDNVPKVKGIGSKTVAKLINMYGSYDDILANEDEIRLLINAKKDKSLSKRLMPLFDPANIEKVRLNKRLIRIGELLTMDEKIRIIQDYANQNIEVNEEAVLEFFKKYQLLEFARDIKNIVFSFRYIKNKLNATGAF